MGGSRSGPRPLAPRASYRELRKSADHRQYWFETLAYRIGIYAERFEGRGAQQIQGSLWREEDRARQGSLETLDRHARFTKQSAVTSTIGQHHLTALHGQETDLLQAILGNERVQRPSINPETLLKGPGWVRGVRDLDSDLEHSHALIQAPNSGEVKVRARYEPWGGRFVSG
jgi:hypothetical protein